MVYRYLNLMIYLYHSYIYIVVIVCYTATHLNNKSVIYYGIVWYNKYNGISLYLNCHIYRGLFFFVRINGPSRKGISMGLRSVLSTLRPGVFASSWGGEITMRMPQKSTKMR